MRDEIEGHEGGRRTAPLWEAVVMDVAPTVEYTAAVMPHAALCAAG